MAIQVVTGEVRFSFVHLTKPFSQTGKEEDLKYSVTCLLPKTDAATKARLDEAVETVKRTAVNEKWDGIAPPVIPIPIWDGDGVKSDGTPYGPECKGHWVFTVSTNADKGAPEIVDSYMNPIINGSDVYSGMYGRVSINVAPYNYKVNNKSIKKGIGFYLGPVQKLRDGEVLGGGRITAAQAFGAPQPQTDADGFMPAPKVDPFSGQPM